MIEQTLADYIKRLQEREVIVPQPAANDNRYNVYPEKQSPDSDEKINPYSQV